MSRLLRTAALIVAWGALTAGALVFVVGPGWFGGSANQAVARPVAVGDQEVVWLSAATNAVAWERFVAAIRRLEADPELGLRIVDDRKAFPSQTTAVPELAVTVRGVKQRLWFRWYKLTGDSGTSQWVDALMAREPPPLAIIGGGSSDRARDLAHDLEQWRGRVARPPLLLFTTATADRIELDGQTCDLMQIYANRSFRFCFTNRQMADAVTDFIWAHDELRPDAEPIYLVRHLDDPYSNDLFDRFREVISGGRYGGELRRTHTARSAARDWAWGAGFAGTGGLPLGLDFEGLRRSDFQEPVPFWSVPIPFSEGDFSQPSYWDAAAAEKLMDEYLTHPGQRRPLLVMPANPPSGRRFLRALVRIAPTEASRFVVATGDAIDFSTIYRDRRLSWPIQDLPFALVIFCHRNPVDPSAFQPDHPGQRGMRPDPTGKTSTSTQDLLLYQDIIATVAAAAYRDGPLQADPDALAAAIRKGRGLPRFDDDGNQQSGAGEYVVWLAPIRQGDRIKPQAVLQVWHRRTGVGSPRFWALERRLTVQYFQPHVVPPRAER